MRDIPRKAVRCEIYGTITAAVDKTHAMNIIRKVVPGITKTDCYTALCILQDRLDNQYR